MTTETNPKPETLDPKVRYSTAMNQAINDLREHSVLQPATKFNLTKALKGRNSTELMQAQADWMLTFTTHHNDAESMGLFAQLLNIISNLPPDTTGSPIERTPAEVLAVRVRAINEAYAELTTEFVNEHGADAYNEACKLINDESWSPYIGEENFQTNVAAAVKAVKTHTLPRGRAVGTVVNKVKANGVAATTNSNGSTQASNQASPPAKPTKATSTTKTTTK
jgi:hypothetical protein